MSFHHKTRLWSVVCLLLCVVLLVCACEGGKNPEVTEAPTDNVTTEKPQDQSTPPAGGAKKTYTVKVQTAEGGMEGVRLQICKGTLCLTPVTTNASGIATFQLDKSENIADYAIKITKFPTGYAGDSEKEYAFVAGTSALGINLTEYRVDLNNMMTGIADVNVSISQASATVATGKTGAQGSIIFLLASGTYTATVEVPAGYLLIGDTNSWELSLEQKNLTVYLLDQNNQIDKTVTVKDHTGAVKAGATVTLWRPDSETAVDTQITDSEGKVTFVGLNSTTNYSVSVTADGRTTQKLSFETFASTSLEVTLLEPAVAVETTYTATVMLGGSAYTQSAVTVSLVCYDTITSDFSIVTTAETQNGAVSFTLIPQFDAFYYVSIASEDLPAGYVLGEEGNYYNLFGFVDSATETSIELVSAPENVGTEETPALWNNFSNFTTPFYTVDDEMSVTLTAGQTYYIQLAWSSGMQLTFTGDATVTYADVTYAAGDTVIFTEESPMQGSAQAVITVTSANGATVTLTTSEAPEVDEGGEENAQ